MLNAFTASTGQDIPPLSKSFMRVLADVVAAQALVTRTHTIDQRNYIFPQTAPEAGLELWGELVNRPREGALPAQLTLTVSGTNGTVIAPGAGAPRWQGANNVVYDTIQGATIGATTSGQANILVQAVTGGLDTTIPAGETLNITSPITGINNQAVVFEVSVFGREEEPIDIWRTSIIQQLAFPPITGTVAWYATSAKEVAGITDCFPYAGNLPGEVTLYCLAQQQLNRTPSAAQLQAVEDYFQQANRDIIFAQPTLPSGTKKLTALSIINRGFDITVNSVSTPTPAIVSAIQANIQAYLEARRPFIVGLSQQNLGIVSVNELTSITQRAITSVSPLVTFSSITLTQAGSPIPLSEYVLGNGEVAVGTVVVT